MHSDHGQTPIEIRDFTPEFGPAFRQINEAWIRRYFELEEVDRQVLADPQTHILDPGGHIFVAVMGAEAIGVCGLLPDGEETFVLTKMGVTPAAQGRGVGLLLGQAAEAYARARGARRLYLESNTLLQPAIRLYRRLGFVEVPGRPTPFRRVDISMEKRLDGEAVPAADV